LIILYNHSFTPNSTVNLWLPWFNYGNQVFFVLFVGKTMVNFRHPQPPINHYVNM